MPQTSGEPDTPSSSWPDQATDLIVQSVETVRDRTVGTAVRVARAIVFGLFAFFIGVLFVVLTCVLLVRILVVYLPNHRAWAAQLVLGGICVVTGLLLYRRGYRVARD